MRFPIEAEVLKLRILAVGALGSLLFTFAGTAQEPGASSELAASARLDAVLAAPASHQILFENEQVRVLRVVIAPGKTEPIHTHAWPSVMRVEVPQPITYVAYEWQAGKLVEARRIQQPLGPPQEAQWMEPEGPHAVTNRGSSEYRAIRYELKPRSTL